MSYTCPRCRRYYADESAAVKETDRRSANFGRWVCPKCFDGPPPPMRKITQDDMTPGKGI